MVKGGDKVSWDPVDCSLFRLGCQFGYTRMDQLASFTSHTYHHPMASWIKWPFWERWRLYLGLADGLLLIKIDLIWLWHRCLSAAEINTGFPTWYPSLGRSSSYLVTSCLYWPTPSWKGHCFVPPGIANHSGYGFAFLAHNASIRGNIHGFTECLIVIVYSIAPHQVAHFIARVGMDLANGIQWS